MKISVTDDRMIKISQIQHFTRLSNYREKWELYVANVTLRPSLSDEKKGEFTELIVWEGRAKSVEHAKSLAGQTAQCLLPIHIIRIVKVIKRR